MKIIKLLSLIVIISTTVSCQKINLNDIIIGTNQQPKAEKSLEQLVYFSYHYENYAWGYQQRGWILDSNGIVHQYDVEAQLSDSTGKTISSEEMQYNINQASKSEQLTSKDELLSHVQLIPQVMKGQLKIDSLFMADAGISSYYVYQYTPTEDNYTKTLLEQSGDLNSHIDCPEAEILRAYLAKINAETID